MAANELDLSSLGVYVVLRWRIFAEEPLAHYLHEQVLGTFERFESAPLFGDMTVIRLPDDDPASGAAQIFEGIGTLSEAHPGILLWAISPMFPRISTWGGSLPPNVSWPAVNMITNGLPAPSAVTSSPPAQPRRESDGADEPEDSPVSDAP